jgi:hypothetical protein
MSTDIVSAVMLSLAARTRQSVEVAVIRRARQMDANLLQMIDDVTAATPQPAPASSQRVDKRA